MEGKKRKEGTEEYRREREDRKRWEKEIGKGKRIERAKERRKTKSRGHHKSYVFRSTTENLPTLWNYFTLSR